MRDDRIRLQDVLEAIEQIEKYATRGRALFDQDELVQTWIIHHLLILGKAAGGLSVDFRKRHPVRKRGRRRSADATSSSIDTSESNWSWFGWSWKTICQS